MPKKLVSYAEYHSTFSQAGGGTASEFVLTDTKATVLVSLAWQKRVRTQILSDNSLAPTPLLLHPSLPRFPVAIRIQQSSKSLGKNQRTF